MALNLLKKATQETVRIQREKKLDPVYEEIKNVWNELRKERQSSVRFDDKTIPVLYRGGAKFGFQQLSGGEKIALFTIVRTVLCRRFTRMGFMLLDEPLEHLDSGNRRLIVDFLVEAFEKGWVDQLLVTTFEESVVRKFSDHKQVSITTL
jgi:DNA repair exonuclease SbcCD ATPase subunit